ncbi:phospholipase A2 group V isoform 1-T1 [Dama dama]|uniref:phospholipase A2 group V isoform X1 n=2 Tax=Dama dama TaxID=30532 RepID=UPI002A371288|nr:phospholipase A2 group V isoform X1 [Dama dama]
MSQDVLMSTCDSGFLQTLEMKGLLMLAWFLACTLPAVPGSLLDLKSMIEKVTGKPALENYGFYGCYCGWGGRGTPLDGTDWCCWKHDHCYAQLETQDCDVLTQAYRYRVSRGLVICEHGSRCQKQLCACDQKFVYCLKRNLRSYNPLYQYFPNFLCI